VQFSKTLKRHPTIPRGQQSRYRPQDPFRTKRMVLDSEKADLEVDQDRPQGIDGPVQHAGISAVADSELKKQATDKDTIDSRTSSGIIEPAPVELQLAQPSKSRSSSVRSRPLSIIPRSKRRGILARLAWIPEVERPYDYKRGTKWLITLVVALAAAAAPMGSSILLRKCCAFLIH